MFFEKKYMEKNGKFTPLIEVIIENNESPIEVLVDTGCDVGLAMLTSQIEDIDLGEKISDEKYKISVADGHILGADVYKRTIELNGEKREISIFVIDHDKIIGVEEKIESLIALGREFLDHFSVLFKGKEKKLVFYK